MVSIMPISTTRNCSAKSGKSSCFKSCLEKIISDSAAGSFFRGSTEETHGNLLKEIRNAEFGMRNQARRARIVLHKRFFRGERQTRFAIENCYGRSFYGLSPKAAAPKGWRGRAESPLLASADAKSSAIIAYCKE